MGHISKIVSKIVNFYSIDLKFEDHLHVSLLNSITNYFEINLGQKVNIGQKPNLGQIF